MLLFIVCWLKEFITRLHENDSHRETQVFQLNTFRICFHVQNMVTSFAVNYTLMPLTISLYFLIKNTDSSYTLYAKFLKHINKTQQTITLNISFNKDLK